MATAATAWSNIETPNYSPFAPQTSREGESQGASRTDKETKIANRDRVVLEHLSLVKNIARRVRETLPVHVDIDDLIHSGILGLIEAANKYDLDKQVTFATYAKFRIKGAILDSLRESDLASRDLRRRHKELRVATDQLTAELERTPTDVEVAERLGVDVARCRQIMADVQSCGLVSADTGLSNEEETQTREFAGNPENQPDHICASEQRQSVLEQAMQKLPERYKQVLVLYYTNQMTMKEISAAMGVNESRVSQIHKAALQKMNSRLTRSGVFSSADV